VFASSSSVYGVNPNLPWKEDDKVLMPISPYASTKLSTELLGHVYSRLFLEFVSSDYAFLLYLARDSAPIWRYTNSPR
jgi:nucleoside-diphosphate-sugar epimerase